MIRELLDFSRIQADKFVMQKRPCNLVEIVRRAVDEVRQTTSTYGRTIFLSLQAEEVVPIIADADRISEVLSNYLSNAHKYSPVERPIMVSLTVEGLLARVAVRDKGPGISPADQKQIWERFYRAPGIETREQSSANSNLGLGLYICKEIIELHQGCVGVESVPGHGATFWFSLGLANSACEQESAQ
jgi:signal transduction histidine kinase